jgi:glycosyltransferase involved in cell wall biosynthesis/SAM-dependent methyltransferase
MNILIFSHSAGLGGAERALVDLIKILKQEHKVVVMLPSLEGGLARCLGNFGIECKIFPLGLSLPNPAATLLQLCDPNVEGIIEGLRKDKYDFIINNTIATLHGMLIARKLGLACITYAHEYLHDEQDLTPHGCSSKFYLKLVYSLSNHILCASEYVKSSFENQKNCSLLKPFEPYSDLTQGHKAAFTEDFFTLLVIGTKSTRKNTHFAVTVAKALRLRGLSVHLHIIGSDNTGSYKLQQQIQIRGEENVYIHPHREDPFDILGKKINLICSYSEPFGLTIPESLARGIPVIASLSGGPNETLPEEFLYAVDSIDGCVRAIEKIARNYDHYSHLSKEVYLQICKINSSESRIKAVSQGLMLALDDFQKLPFSDASSYLSPFKKILAPPIVFDDIIKNISTVSMQSREYLTPSQIRELIAHEHRAPGAAVLRDVLDFNVVPFAHSPNMDLLYKNGLGLAIELLANIGDAGKKYMLAYILLRLQELSSKNPKIKVLCLGDGLGIDSMILASCGFNTDYIDFDSSLMSKCAKLNIETANNNAKNVLPVAIPSHASPPYDVIISLEVIEHVPNPISFLNYVSDNLAEDGLFFASECFDGIYDRWPTHLYLNEKYAGALPIVAAPFFKVLDINMQPPGKPYLFCKNSSRLSPREMSPLLISSANYLNIFGYSKSKVGF